MKLNSRGVNAIISTFLIIVISLIAIFLLWYFLKPVFGEGEKQLGASKECLDLRVEPVKCSYEVLIGSKTHVAVDMRRGPADGNIEDLLFSFSSDKGGVKLASAGAPDPNVNSDPIPGPNEYALMGFNLSHEFIPESVEVFSVVAKNNKPFVCPLVTKKIECGLFEFDECADCNLDSVLNIADIGCFQTSFAQSKPEADINKDGQFNILDFLAFTSSFNSGIINCE